MPNDESKLPRFASNVTEDLLLGVGADVPLSAEDDPARIAGIAAEFKMGFEALAEPDRAGTDLHRQRAARRCRHRCRDG